MFSVAPRYGRAIVTVLLPASLPLLVITYTLYEAVSPALATPAAVRNSSAVVGDAHPTCDYYFRLRDASTDANTRGLSQTA